MQLILASQSSARRRLMDRLSVPFTAFSPEVDEDSYKARGGRPRAIAAALAEAKARVIAEANPKAVVIGSDQMLIYKQRIFGKPGTAAAARAQLQLLAGKKVSLITAVHVCHGRKQKKFIDETQLVFRPLTKREIAAYVKADGPVDCAGSFKFESGGILLFAKVHTEDPTAIEGLPLIRLAKALRELGVRLPF